MKIIKYYLALLIIFFSQSLFAQTAASQLSQYLNHFTTFQADFNQNTVSQSHRAMQSSNGKMMLMRPGRFRWDTQNPSHQIVVTNGKTLWIYDIDLKQVTKQSLSQSGADPAQLLSGNVNHILAQFNVMILKQANHTISFQLKPKKLSQQFKSVLMVFENNQLTELQVVNSLNQITIFKFSHIILNAPLSPNLFNFKAPAGVDAL